MQNAVRVRRLQRVGDLQAQPNGRRRRVGSAQLAPVDELQHEIVRADVVDLADVRMVHGRDRARLLLKALLPVRIAGQRGGQDFDGNVALQARIARAIDVAHPAGTERGDDFVRSETSAGREVHAPCYRGPRLERRGAVAVARDYSQRARIDADLREGGAKLVRQPDEFVRLWDDRLKVVRRPDDLAGATSHTDRSYAASARSDAPSAAPSSRNKPAPSPRQALPCMHANVVGASRASRSSTLTVEGACAK
jgi:hypothetical protein